MYKSHVPDVRNRRKGNVGVDVEAGGPINKKGPTDQVVTRNGMGPILFSGGQRLGFFPEA